MPKEEEGAVEPVYLDAKDAGRLISVSAWTIRDLSRRGLLTAHQIGPHNTLRWKKEEVLAVMKKVERRPSSAVA